MIPKLIELEQLLKADDHKQIHNYKWSFEFNKFIQKERDHNPVC